MNAKLKSMPRSRGAQRWARWMEWLARYHRCEVVGAHNVPPTGGVVLAGTHSLASYELFIVSHFSDDVLGRTTNIIGDDLLFRMPGLGTVLRDSHFVPGRRDSAVQRLKDGDMLGIAPGGMKESLRGHGRRYTYDWSRRKGFAAVAMKAGVPVVPVCCPNADDIFHVYDNPLTRGVYRALKVPAPVFRGRWGTPLPRPVKLVHWLGEPIHPHVPPEEVTPAAVDAFHARITEALDALVAKAIATGDRLEGVPDVLPLGGWR
ncbi:MAG: lysophospholipid acyltransferase family protein [Myxococcota bacterium]